MASAEAPPPWRDPDIDRRAGRRLAAVARVLLLAFVLVYARSIDVHPHNGWGGEALAAGAALAPGANDATSKLRWPCRCSASPRAA